MKIYYFAWVRDYIGYPYEDISCPKTVKTIEQLAHYLKDQSDGHRRAFQDLSSIRAAKNQKFVANDSEVADTDEVAFFPPVTGG